MTKTVGNVFSSELKSQGVKRIFGIPGGGSSVDLIDACSKEHITFELVQQESSAAIMAVVSGELTSSLGACISIMGPGAANLASGASYAYLERHPLLVFSECYGPKISPSMTLQKIDHQSLFNSVSKGSNVLDEMRTKSCLTEAVLTAKTERPGPYHIDIPNALLTSDYLGTSDDLNDCSDSDSSDISAVTQIADTINSSERPLLVIGPMAARENLGHLLIDLIEKAGIAFMVTSKARGIITEDHPLYAGIVSGVYATNTFEAGMIGRSDLIIGVGLDRSELLSGWQHDQPFIEIDSIYIEEDEKITTPIFTTYGQVSEVIKGITDGVINKNRWPLEFLSEYWSNVRGNLRINSDTFNSGAVIGLCRELCPDETILCTEAGVYGRVGLYAWKVKGNRTYFDSSGANTMGFSIPAVISASLELPNQKSIAFVGDGGFMMKISELETIARMKTKPIIIVFNDGTLGMIRIKQKQKGLARDGVDLYQPNLVKIAESFGGRGRLVQDISEFKTALDQALKSDTFEIIDLRFDPDIYAADIPLIRG